MIYVELFLNFLKIGLFTIGGGYAMIPIIYSTAVTEKAWISEELFYNFIGIAESTPGPFAVNIATFIGNSQAGIVGGIAAVLGLFVPSFVIIFLIYKLSKRFIKNKFVKDGMSALQPTVVALIASAFITVALATFFPTDAQSGARSFNWFGLILFAACFIVLRFVKKVHPIFLIIISAGLGILFYGFILPQ